MMEKIKKKVQKHEGVDTAELIVKLNEYATGVGSTVAAARDWLYVKLFELISYWTWTIVKTGRSVEDEILQANVALKAMDNVLKKAQKFAAYGKECIMAALKKSVKNISCSSFTAKHRAKHDENGCELSPRMYQTVDLDVVANVLSGTGSIDGCLESIERAELKRIIENAVASGGKKMQVFYEMYFCEGKSMQYIADFLGYKSVQSVSNLKNELCRTVGKALVDEGYFTKKQLEMAKPVQRNNRTSQSDERQIYAHAK